MSCIALQHLSKQFVAHGQTVPAVANLNLTVAAGEFLTLVGPSGSGKTTTLRLIAGLESPDAGDVMIDDRIVNKLPPRDRDVAMVFQRDALFPHLTAFENLAFGLKVRGVGRGEIQQRVGEVAGKLGIAACLARTPGGLSSGQRQRVALGRALVRRPTTLLLDEPFANLDAPLRRELRHELLRLHRAEQLTILLVTHDQVEALALGQRVAVMNAGALEQVGTPAELREKPATAFVREFLDASAL